MPEVLSYYGVNRSEFCAPNVDSAVQRAINPVPQFRIAASAEPVSGSRQRMPNSWSHQRMAFILAHFRGNA